MIAIRYAMELGRNPEGPRAITKWPLVRGIDVESFPGVRNRLISPVQAAYCMSHRAIINPRGEDLSVVYGASGPDITTPLLSCDPKTITCIDILRMNEESLGEAMVEWGHYNDPSVKIEIKQETKNRCNRHFWFGEIVDIHLERLIALELKKLGVKRSSIIFETPGDCLTEIHFKWAYPGGPLKDRTVRYHHADLTCPASYSKALKDRLDKGFDVYYQKSAMQCISKHREYMHDVIRGVKKCVLVSPTPANRPDQGIDENVWRFLGQRHHRLSHINEKYAGLFLSAAAANNEDLDVYNWYMELWVKLGGK